MMRRVLSLLPATPISAGGWLVRLPSPFGKVGPVLLEATVDYQAVLHRKEALRSGTACGL